MKQCCRFCLDISVGAVPKNTRKAKKARNANKAGSPRGGFSKSRVPSRSAESEAGRYKSSDSKTNYWPKYLQVFLIALTVCRLSGERPRHTPRGAPPLGCVPRSPPSGEGSRHTGYLARLPARSSVSASVQASESAPAPISISAALLAASTLQHYSSMVNISSTIKY